MKVINIIIDERNFKLTMNCDEILDKTKTKMKKSES